MRAVQFEAPGRIALVDRPRPTPGPGEVAIAVDRVGVCATDLHMMHGTFPTASYPVTPGHEATGIVDSVGDGVVDLRPGMRVVLDPGMPCRGCRPCRKGRLNLCERRRAYGVTDNGAATELLIVGQENCVPIATSTPAGTAVLGEPLACVVHAFDLVLDPAGSTVLVYGAGTVGILASVVARTLGAVHVAVVDLNDARLERASAAGADETAASSASLDHARFDLVVDATGAARAISDGISRVDRGGNFLQIGVATADARVEISPYEMFAREMSIVGSMTTRYSFPRAVALLESGRVPADLITGDPVALDSYASAIDDAERGDVPKVTVSPRS